MGQRHFGMDSVNGRRWCLAGRERVLYVYDHRMSFFVARARYTTVFGDGKLLTGRAEEERVREREDAGWQ